MGTGPVFRFMAVAICVAFSGQATALSILDTPLFLNGNNKADVLVLYGNSNSMDSDPSGAGIGAANAGSKSEIARNAIKSIVADYTGKINMGLMAYQQGTPAWWWLSAVQYDVSFNPANYNPNFALSYSNRNSTTKKYRAVNPTDSSSYIYYNVGSQSSYSADLGNGFFYSPTACTDPTHNFAGVSTSSTAAVGCTAMESNIVDSGHPYGIGPWDIYTYYLTKTGTSDLAPGQSGAGYSGASGTYYYYPGDTDIGQGLSDFGKVIAQERAGMGWFLNSSPGMGYIHIPVRFLDTTSNGVNQVSLINTKLGTEVMLSSANSPYSATQPFMNFGLTPLEGAVLTANNYFNAVTLPSTQGGPQAAPPVSCGKNFFVLLTDGLPSVSRSGVPLTTDVTSNLNAVATQLAAAKASSASVVSYIVGFALPLSVNPNQLNVLATSGGSGAPFIANDTATLNASFASIFSDILARTAAASSISLNSGSWNTGSMLYQARFNSNDWSGQLLAYKVNANGSQAGTAVWDAGQVLNGQNWDTGRTILTYKPSATAGNHGIPFRWPANPAAPAATELDAAQVAVLNLNSSGATDANGSLRLAWMRGNRSSEAAICGASCALLLRDRPTSVLGDIVDSSPYYVGAPPFNYLDNVAPTSYSTFYGNWKGRPAVVYVGANDGMLHGFDAATGAERLAYIPSKLYSATRLGQSSQTTYTHRFFVDGSPNVQDAWLASDSAWHSVLVGGLGAGGQGVYALDVTDPAHFAESATTPKKVVLWEFNDTGDQGDADTVADPSMKYGLGYTFGQPIIVRSNASDTLTPSHARNRWVVILGNGYNNTDSDGAANTSGHAILYILDATTGAVIRKLNAKLPADSTALPNGLASPTAIDADGNGTVDYVFAGDLNGNLWKFDLSDTNPANWKVAFGTATTPLPLVSNTRSGQVITSEPSVSKAANGGFMVYFGTGKYMENADSTSVAVQSFYGIWDKNDGSTHYTLGAGTGLGANLLQQTIDDTVSTTDSSGQAYSWRVTSQASSGTTASAAISSAGSFLGAYNGWYMDLPAGERVVTASKLTSSGKVVFSTLVPNTAACSYGGNGWIMELDALRGDRLGLTFDVDNNGVINALDKVSSRDGTVAPSGMQVAGIPTTPTILGGNPSGPHGEVKIWNQSNGNVGAKLESATVRQGRVSWQQLQ